MRLCRIACAKNGQLVLYGCQCRKTDTLLIGLMDTEFDFVFSADLVSIEGDGNRVGDDVAFEPGGGWIGEFVEGMLGNRLVPGPFDGELEEDGGL